MFNVCLAKRQSRWRGGAGSVLLHVLVGAVLIGLTPRSEHQGLLNLSDGPLVLRIREPIYIPSDLLDQSQASGAPESDKVRAGGRRRQAQRSALGARLELPMPPVLSRDGSLLLQPPIAVPQAKAAEVPPMAFWSRERPAIRPKLVIPGRSEPVSPLPELAAPPRLEVPNHEDKIAQINIATTASLPNPSLAIPASATTPATIPRSPSPQSVARAGISDALAGEPAHVLSDSVLPADRVVAVPRSVAGPPGQAPGDSGLDPADPRGRGNASSGSGTSGRPGATALASEPAGVAGLGKTREGSLPPSRDLKVARPSTVVLPDHSIRTTYPPGGKFDVIVVQSALPNAFLQGAGILVGRPIYTVYLHVGPGKDWILQYCAVPSVSQHPRAQVVNLSGVPGIEAPYPISTTIPVLSPRAKYLLVHGVLGADGRFRDLKLASGEAGISPQELFRYLETWSFRPVTQAARPIDVEALLAIPPT